jgi:uncharacterized protein YdcH (DUF465 family)
VIYYLLLFLIHSFTFSVVISEDGYYNVAHVPAVPDKYTPSQQTVYHYETHYIPAPRFNKRWFIEEQLKNNQPLFKKYSELGNCTLIETIEKTEGLADLKIEFLKKHKNKIKDLITKLFKEDNGEKHYLQNLPPELQLKILKETYPALLKKIELMEYRDLCNNDTIPARD